MILSDVHLHAAFDDKTFVDDTYVLTIYIDEKEFSSGKDLLTTVYQNRAALIFSNSVFSSKDCVGTNIEL